MVPRRRDPRRPFIVAHFVGLFGLVGWFWLSGGTQSASAVPAQSKQAEGSSDRRTVPEDPVPEPPALELPASIDLRKAELRDGRYVQRLDDGSSVELTLHPRLQQKAERMLASYGMRFGSLVALDPSSGDVLAFAEKVTDRSVSGPRPALDARHPAASVFKIVTGAALLSKAGVKPSERVCVHGGLRRLTDREIIGNKRYDNRCRRFSAALGHSDNAVFARLAYHRLDFDDLSTVAESFGFNRSLDLPWDLPPSTIELHPDGPRTELARTAAGFWNTTLSPVHAALITAAVANGGEMMRPRRVARWVAADGSVIAEPEPRSLGRVVSARTAHVLGRMMVETTARGTGRKSFAGRKSWPWRQTVEVAGKTGTLSSKGPDHTAYTWFVAFAPAQDPRIALAALVGNSDRWWIKGVHLVRDTLAEFVREEGLAPGTDKRKRTAGR